MGTRRDTTDKAAQRKERAEAMQATIATQLEAMAQSDGWTAFLDYIAHFHGYSLKNTLLIMAQRPSACQVAGFRKWQELGRQVRKGEKAIRIFGFSHRNRTETDPDDINCPITASHALYVGDGNGDGIVIEGDLAALARWVDKIHNHIHRTIAADLARWAELFGNGELADELAPKLNCGEAEITAAALHAAGNSAAATTFLNAHIARDTEDGETHDSDGTGQEPID